MAIMVTQIAIATKYLVVEEFIFCFMI